MESNNRSFLVVFLLLCMVWIINYFTPMQSDDYRYYLKGISIDATVHQYVSWGGRLVADFISSALLITNSRLLISILNSLALICLIYFIAKIPRANDKLSAPIFFTIFVMYWVANPNLGQTTFWVVGSANYVWTNLVLCLFLYSLMKFSESDISPKRLVLLCFLGFFAGIGNENTSLTLFFIVLFLWFCSIYEAFSHKGNSRKILIVSFFVLLGALILIFSPGNDVRLSYPDFIDWRSSSLLEKAHIHFYNKLPRTFSYFWPVFILMVPALSLLRKQNLLQLVFFFGSIAAAMAFLFSPAMPNRAINGALILLLISLSYMLHSISLRRDKYVTALVSLVVLGMTLLYFIPSYITMFNSYSAMSKQSLVRDRAILIAKQQNLKSVTIPKFFPGYLVRPGDMIDTYFNSETISSYFDYDGDISEVNLNFDYSKNVDSHKVCYKGDNISVFYNKYNQRAFYVLSKSLLESITAEKEFAVFVHLYKDRNDKEYISRNFSPSVIRYNDMNLIIYPSDFGRYDLIESGIYSSVNNTVIERFEFYVEDCEVEK